MNSTSAKKIIRSGIFHLVFQFTNEVPYRISGFRQRNPLVGFWHTSTVFCFLVSSSQLIHHITAGSSFPNTFFLHETFLCLVNAVGKAYLGHKTCIPVSYGEERTLVTLWGVCIIILIEERPLFPKFMSTCLESKNGVRFFQYDKQNYCLLNLQKRIPS